jgi:hypothetical protein
MYTLPKVVVPKITDVASMDGLILSLLSSVMSSVKKNKPNPFAFFLKERLLEAGDRKAVNIALFHFSEALRQRKNETESLAHAIAGSPAKEVNISSQGSSYAITSGQASNATPKLTRNQKRRQRRKAKLKLMSTSVTPVVSIGSPAVKTESLSKIILKRLLGAE